MDGDAVGELDQSVSYVIKQVQATMHSGMDGVLRPLGLTVAQYACLEMLGRQPGLSNSELARGAFVTRQSMNTVLRGLQDRGLLTRPDRSVLGRTLPTSLTPTGHAILQTASVGVRSVERELFSPLSETKREQLREALADCLRQHKERSLREPAD